MTRLGPLLLLLAGCPSTAEVVEPGVEPYGEWDEVLPRACDAPIEGFDRFTEQSVQRGITPDLDIPAAGPPGQAVGVSVLALDGDADGDVDLFFPDPNGLPQTFENDGAGYFTQVPQVDSPGFAPAPVGATIGLADVDGDRLPDIVALTGGVIVFAENLGGLTFAPLREVHIDPQSQQSVSVSMSFGDLDGDGDLDLAVPRNHRVNGDPMDGSTDRVYLRDGGTWTLEMELMPDDEAGLSLVTAWTDFDRDGDVDLLALSDLGNIGRPPTALYRNDDGELTNVAPTVGADLAMAGMGVDVADLNGDGRLDYCMTDIGPVRCLMSSEDGFIEGAAAMGLQSPDVEGVWSGWSADLVDLDHDGRLDFVVAAAPPPNGQAELDVQPDGWFRGVDGGFEEVGTGLGLADEDYHWGLATADLDGDGFAEVVVSGDSVKAWWNSCGEGAWIEVELVGDAANSMALGALVEVDDGTQVRLREVHGLRSQGQTPWLRFGLGDVDVVPRITVTWPDGAVSEVGGVPTRRRIVLTR
jgi:enediyne biosynthesis protein E4